MNDRLFDVAPVGPGTAATALSYGQRLTIRARTAIANGRHPANGLPIDTTHTCGTCDHLNRYEYHTRTRIKCPMHRLGESHSEASDMRTNWPACPHYTATP